MAHTGLPLNQSRCARAQAPHGPDGTRVPSKVVEALSQNGYGMCVCVCVRVRVGVCVAQKLLQRGVLLTEHQQKDWQ